MSWEMVFVNLLLLPVSLLPAVFGMRGKLYVIPAAVLGIFYLLGTVGLALSPTKPTAGAVICSLPAAAAHGDGYLLKGNVVMELIKLLENITFDENKPVLRTLLPGPGPRVMLLYLHAGQSLPEHAASDTITVQALSGWTTFYDGPVPFEMKSGTLLRLEAGRPHALIAQEDSVLLVTVLSWPESKGSSVENSVLDLRGVARGQRHPLVFARVSGMAVGQSFTIINDHDPQPLRRQLELQFMDEISWDYLERGPEAFRVCIARVRSPAETSGKARLPGALAG